MEIKCFNTKHLTRGSLKIRIVKVDSPTFLWVQLENSREDFEELLEDLTRRMTRRGRLLRHRPDHILPNEIVAVREGNCDTAGHRRYGHHRPARLGACHPTAVSRYIYLRGQIPRTGMAGYPLRARSHPACGSKGTVATKS